MEQSLGALLQEVESRLRGSGIVIVSDEERHLIYFAVDIDVVDDVDSVTIRISKDVNTLSLDIPR